MTRIEESKAWPRFYSWIASYDAVEDLPLPTLFPTIAYISSAITICVLLFRVKVGGTIIVVVTNTITVPIHFFCNRNQLTARSHIPLYPTARITTSSGGGGWSWRLTNWFLT